MSILPQHNDEVGDELDRVVELLHDCEHHELTEWESSFIESLRNRIATHGERTRISSRQWDAINDIEEKIY